MQNETDWEKKDLMNRLKHCRSCNRLNTALNRLDIDSGALYTSAEVAWILRMVLEIENELPEGTERQEKSLLAATGQAKSN